MKLVALLAAVALLAGCGGTAGSGDSGIRGRAIIRSCGVPFSEQECANPPPYVGQINVLRTYRGPIVRTFRSDDGGRFVVRLEPGRYVLESQSGGFPLLKPVEVVVREHAFTRLTLTFDSGIR
jgi:hypothetical protein